MNLSTLNPAMYGESFNLLGYLIFGRTVRRVINIKKYAKKVNIVSNSYSHDLRGRRSDYFTIMHFIP